MREREARRIVYTRSERTCERCGNWPALEWHHRKNRSQGGSWSPANGLHLCSDCHRHITTEPFDSYARGWLVRSSDDPAAIPVRYRGRCVRLDDDGVVTTVERAV